MARARQLIAHLEGELIRGCRHDMCFSQRRIVDALVLDFLKIETTSRPAWISVRWPNRTSAA
jgi:hypothetical protein